MRPKVAFGIFELWDFRKLGTTEYFIQIGEPRPISNLPNLGAAYYGYGSGGSYSPPNRIAHHRPRSSLRQKDALPRLVPVHRSHART